MKFLHNHVGYSADDAKLALLQTDAAFSGGRFSIYAVGVAEPVVTGTLRGRVPS